MRCTSANQPAKGPSFAVKPCIRFRLARKPTSAIGAICDGFTPLCGASAIRCTLAARNRIGGKILPLGSRVTFAQPRVHFGEIGQSIRFAARNRSRCTTSATGLAGERSRAACGSHRPGLGASATLHTGQPVSVRFAVDQERRQAARRSRFGCGCGAVRIRSRCGSHRQRAALPRPGLGADAVLRLVFPETFQQPYQ
jgi:hypothetical protein